MLPRCLILPTSVLLSLTLLSACHRPERVEDSRAGDSSLDCASIKQEISYAEQAKARAREHDRFEFRYMLIVPAFVSAYNFHKAEKAADERRENMQRLYNANNCANQPVRQPSYQQPYQQQPSPYSNGAPYGGGSTYNYPYNGSQSPVVPGMGQQQSPMIPGGMMSDPMMQPPMMPGRKGEMPPPRNYPGY